MGHKISMHRAELITQIAAHITRLKRPPPAKIAIDGIDASGKTTLADELAVFLQQAGHPIIRASIDGFHNPREVRHQKGPLSSEGYFYDSYQIRIKGRDLSISGPPMKTSGGTNEFRMVLKPIAALALD
ncbi:MAG: hypothetical protein HND46_22960 [Chloroflexi bacterium]|nr:hypothetical protein [Chloroflexota bacterium]